MEDKKITPQESMALIAQMIESSKQRVAMPDLHISIMWAVLTILTAATVLTGMLLFHSPWINLVWFAIPAIGVPVNIIMVKKSGVVKGAKTLIDTVSDGIWKTVGFIAIALSLMCLVFNLLGHPEAWLVMFYYAFIMVGFGAAMTGILLKENSYIFRRCILYHCGICGYSSPNLHDTVAYSVGATALYALLPADVHSTRLL